MVGGSGTGVFGGAAAGEGSDLTWPSAVWMATDGQWMDGEGWREWDGMGWDGIGGGWAMGGRWTVFRWSCRSRLTRGVAWLGPSGLDCSSRIPDVQYSTQGWKVRLVVEGMELGYRHIGSVSTVAGGHPHGMQVAAGIQSHPQVAQHSWNSPVDGSMGDNSQAELRQPARLVAQPLLVLHVTRPRRLWSSMRCSRAGEEEEEEEDDDDAAAAYQPRGVSNQKVVSTDGMQGMMGWMDGWMNGGDGWHGWKLVQRGLQ